MKHHQILGSNITEAIADVETFESDTHVNHPSQEAIEDAKQWVEENEL